MAVALAAASVVGAGCAGAGLDPKAALPAAPERTAAEGTALVTIDRFTVHAEGQIDFARGRMLVTVGVGGPTRTRAATTDVLVADDRAFTRPTGAAAWSEVSLDTVGLASLPGDLVSGDPFVALALLRGTDHITTFGGLQVQEASTIRYDLGVDPAAAAAAAVQAGAGPATKAASLAGRLRRIAAALSHVVREDAYLDEKGRVRRLELPENLTLAVPVTRPDTARVATTIDFSHFGIPVSIPDPPPVESTG